MLAEAGPTPQPQQDEAWIAQTLQLFEAMDEDTDGLLDDDELDAAEEGFMLGYESDFDE